MTIEKEIADFLRPIDHTLSIKEQILSYLEGYYGEKFHEINELFGRGDWAISTPQLLGLNIILWFGLSEDAAVAICELHNEKLIQYVPATWMPLHPFGSDDSSVCFVSDMSIPIGRTVGKKLPRKRYQKTRWFEVWVKKVE